MMAHTRNRTPRNLMTGFTIFEAIIVLIVIGIIALILMSLQRTLWSGSMAGTEYQAATLAQKQCAEKIISTKRHIGYNGITSTTCSTLPAIQGISTSVTISTGTLSTCITGANEATGCGALNTTIRYKDISISAIVSNSAKLNPITLRIFEF